MESLMDLQHPLRAGQLKCWAGLISQHIKPALFGQFISRGPRSLQHTGQIPGQLRGHGGTQLTKAMAETIRTIVN
jgi:hypothetical protein